MTESLSKCPECFSTNLKVGPVREVRRPARKSKSKGSEQPVVARSIEVTCRRCKWSGTVLRRAKGGTR